MMLKRATLRTVLAAILLVVGGAGLGKIVETPVPWWTVLVSAVLFLVGIVLQWQTVSPYRRFHTSNLRKMPAEQREVLVLFLSAIRDPLPPFVQITGDLEHDLQTLAARKREQSLAAQRIDFWSWEQPLRAIHHNRRNGPLRRVILLGSKESVVQFDAFADQVFRKYPDLKNHVRLEAFYKTTRKIKLLDEPAVRPAEQNGFDFEDFDELTRALEELIKQLCQDAAHPESPDKIQIDFTGGQKPTSVVAAVVTMFSRLSNLYVATNPRDPKANEWAYDVWGYDFREQRAPED
jgi:hypothetical protein